MKRRSLILDVLIEDIWRPVTAYLDSNPFIRRLFITLVAIIFLINVTALIDKAFVLPQAENEHSQLLQYRKQAQSDLQKINTASRRTLDSLSKDSTLPFYVQYMNREGLGLFLRPYRDYWLRSALRSSETSAEIKGNDLGLAIYDATNKLRGWYTTDLSSPGYDTVFVAGSALARKSTLTVIDSDVFNLWYLNARKLISAQGEYIGYVLVKYRIARRNQQIPEQGWAWNELNSNQPPDKSAFAFHTVSPIQSSISPPIYIDTLEHNIAVGYFEFSSQKRLLLQPSPTATIIKYIGGTAEILFIALLCALFSIITLARISTSIGRFILYISWVTILLLLIRTAMYYWGDTFFLLSTVQEDHALRSNMSSFDPLEVSITIIFLFYILWLFATGIGQLRSRFIQKAPSLSIYLYSSTIVIIPVLVLLLEKAGGAVLSQYSSGQVPLATMICLTFTTAFIWYIIYLLYRSVLSVITAASTSVVFSVIIVCLYLAAQIALTTVFSGVYYFAYEWQLVISGLLVLSSFVAVRADSTWYNSLKQSLHPSVRIVLVLCGAAAISSLLLQENKIAVSVKAAHLVTARVASESTIATTTVADSALHEFTHVIHDSSIDSREAFLSHSYFYWYQFLRSHQDKDIAFSISNRLTGEILLQVQNTSDTYFPDSLARPLVGFDSVASFSEPSKNIPVAYTLILPSRKERVLLSTARLYDIIWPERPSDDITSMMPLGIVDIKTRKSRGTTSFPEGLIAQIQYPSRGRTSRGSELQYASGRPYRVVSEPVSEADSQKVVVAAIALPVPKEFITLITPVLLICIFLVALVFFLILLWKLVGNGQVKISLQEKILFIVFCSTIVVYVALSLSMKNILYSQTSTAYAERLEQKKDVLRSEPMIDLHSDSVVVFEDRLRRTAVSLNSDLALFDDKNILKASTSPALFDFAVLPKTLPLVFSRRISASTPNQYEGTTTILQTPLGYWVLAVDLPIVGKRPPYKLLLLQKHDSYSAFQQIVLSEISGSIIVFILLLIILASYLSSRLTRPISKLRLAATAIATNNLDIALPSKRRDEIGELVDSFEKMTAELSKGHERVVQVEREGAWKEMARQVAHEIKNPLTPMKLSIQHVQHAFEHQDTNFQNIFKRVVRTLTEQIDVLTRIATEFARFGEMPRRRYMFVSLPYVVESALALFDAERSRIRFAIDIPKSLPSIYADEEEFRRALVNLIKNAIQAIDKWGVLLISAYERSGLIHLQITDSGTGMKEETLKKAFDPNFSTKTSGMGLGLAIVKKTITDMSGTIRVESHPGEGTTFFIELPARGEQGTPQS